MAWNLNNISIEEIFDKMLDFLEDRAGTESALYVSGFGEYSATALGAWAGILMILGSRILRYARGIAVMNGRSEPNANDFIQVLNLIDNGFVSLLSRSQAGPYVESRVLRRGGHFNNDSEFNNQEE